MVSAVVAGGGRPLAHTGAPDWAAEPPPRGCGIPRPPSHCPLPTCFGLSPTVDKASPIPHIHEDLPLNFQVHQVTKTSQIIRCL